MPLNGDSALGVRKQSTPVVARLHEPHKDLLDLRDSLREAA
jgi:hypothetical protein